MGCNQLVGEDLSSPLVNKWVIVPYEDPLEFSPQATSNLGDMRLRGETTQEVLE